MAEANKYYPKQMNGAVISAFGQARDDEYNDANTIEKYLYQLSIETANETELENIGKLIGYPRPLVPEGFVTENLFLFGDLPIKQDMFTGFADLNGVNGGELSSLEKSESSFMSLGMYRKFLTYIAIIKRYGITIYAIDKIASIFGITYELSWSANGDINLNFTQTLGYKNLWILTQLFYRFATAPQVIITSVS